MSDPSRPYGADTLIIPFTFVRTGPSRRVGADLALPASDGLASDGPRRSHAPVGANLRSAENVYPMSNSQSSPVVKAAYGDGGTETFVQLPNGNLPVDEDSHPLRIASPVADLSPVARAGRAAGETRALAPADDAGSSELAFFTAMGRDVGTGGRFNYQRSGSQIPGVLGISKFQRHSSYVDVSNVNVGLWLQQAGYSLEDSLKLAGRYSLNVSNNRGNRTSSGLFPEQQKFLIRGWQLGASGAYGPPAKRKQ